MTSKASERLENRKFISKSEAKQLILRVVEAQLKGPESNDLEDTLITKLGEWADTTRFDQARLDQVLSGRLLVRLNTDCQKLEFHAPLEGDSRSTRGPNREHASLRDHTASLSESFFRPLNPTDGEDTLQ
jgi:hypothetical protein